MLLVYPVLKKIVCTGLIRSVMKSDHAVWHGYLGFLGHRGNGRIFDNDRPMQEVVSLKLLYEAPFTVCSPAWGFGDTQALQVPSKQRASVSEHHAIGGQPLGNRP